MTAWTTAADVRARVRRRWDDGSLLRAWAASAEFPVIEVPVRGPKAGDIGDDVVAVRDWSEALDRAAAGGRCFDIVRAAVGGRHIGRNTLPVRAVVSRYEQAWSLLGVEAEVATLGSLLAQTEEDPVVSAWARARPHRALALAADWPTLLAATRWLDGHRGSGRHLRQITAPGVDTKFVERNRGVLAEVLGVRSTSSGFLTDLGLRTRPQTVRIRADPTTGVAGPFTDVVVPRAELAALDVVVRSALVVENEVTFLSVPVPVGGVVIWGKGFEVDRAGSLPWLASVRVTYWGDLDTHGFAILDRLRAWLPQTSSVLMDRTTLLEHRPRWVTEPAPARSRLTHLTSAEGDLYDDLVSDRLGERVRLEQERVDWAWATSRLA